MSMRFDRIDVSNVPKQGRYFSRESIGMCLNYNIGEYSGEAKILDIIQSEKYPKIKFLISNDVYEVSQNNINNYITQLFYGSGYVYKAEDVVNGLIIIDINEKVARVKCENDGYEFNISLSDLRKGKGCSVCNKRIIVRGINDFNTTHPQMAKYLDNYNDGYYNFYGSSNNVVVKCPVCGSKRETTFNMLTQKGFSCKKCSDGISFGEKYFCNLLVQLNVKFNTQVTFDWSAKKKYDFYIEDRNCIVEIHGMQHYIDVSSWNSSVKYQENNDEFKMNVAKENGIHNYIIIDAKQSDSEYIKNSIMISLFSELYDLSEIDWDKCYKATLKSMVHECANMWNNGYNVKSIAEHNHLSVSVVRKYLKQATVCKLTNYAPKQGQHLNKEQVL